MRSLGLMLLGVAAMVGILFLSTIDRKVDVAKCATKLDEQVSSFSPELLRDLCSAIWSGRFSQDDVVQNQDWPWRALLDRKIGVGMSTKMVRVGWGYPRGILHTEDGEELWVYWSNLLHFKWDRLVSMERFLSCTASELAAAYAENEIAAEGMYEQGFLLLKGTVSDIGKAPGGEFYVSFEREGSFLPSVYCYFPETQLERLSRVKRGGTLYVFGKCTGKNPFWGQVMLEDCVAL